MDWEKLLIFYANHGALAGFEGDFPLRLDFQHPARASLRFAGAKCRPKRGGRSLVSRELYQLDVLESRLMKMDFDFLYPHGAGHAIGPGIIAAAG